MSSAPPHERSVSCDICSPDANSVICGCTLCTSRSPTDICPIVAGLLHKPEATIYQRDCRPRCMLRNVYRF